MIQLLAIVIAALAPLTVQAELSKLTIYYQTLCPETRVFFKEQLVPTMMKLGYGDMKVEFLPFGNSTYTYDGNEGYTFTCHNGDDECKGNMVQACALKMLEKDEALQFSFITCMMTDADPPTAGKMCAIKLGMSWENLEKCSIGIEGQRLLATYGARTKSLEPPLKHIPTIYYQNDYIEEDDWAAQKDLLGTVCKHYTEYSEYIPSACN